VGVVGTTTHWTGPLFQALIAAFRCGDTRRAQALNAALIDSFQFVNSDDSVYPMSIKAMLDTLGLPVGHCRLPLPPAAAAVKDRARAVWAELQARSLVA